MIQLLERTEVKDYQAIAAALSRDLAASAIERDLKAGIPEEEVRKFKESGLLLLTIPKQYGGIGAGWLDAGKVIQELGCDGKSDRHQSRDNHYQSHL
jgi:alkylation response protein AidB-like acyl-CoA dehydrogenase